MVKRLFSIATLSLSLLSSFSCAKSLRIELYNSADALSEKWVRESVSQLDITDKKLIYNVLGLSATLCVAPSEEIYNAYLQCSNYIENNEDTKKSKNALAAFHQMVEMVNEPYLEFLHIKTKQLRSIRTDLDENDIDHAQMMQAQKFMVTVLLSFYDAIHNHMHSLDNSETMDKCMFDEFGMIPEERRELSLPAPELISQLYTMLTSPEQVA